jgi:hypothetical protein
MEGKSLLSMILTQNRLFEYFGLVIYTLIMSVVLMVLHVSYTGVTFWLLLVPMFVLWKRADLRTRLLPLVALLGFGVVLLLQLYAYRYGLWYELSTSSVQLWRVPLASLWFGVTLMLYYVVLYEYFFDDQKSRLRTNKIARSIAVTITGLALLIGYLWAFPVPALPFPFVVLIGVLVVSLVLLFRAQPLTERFILLKKSLWFSIAIFPLSLVFEVVFLSTNTRFFANIPEYVYTFSLATSVVPLEQLFLLILTPLWVVLLYEIILDDGR